MLFHHLSSTQGCGSLNSLNLHCVFTAQHTYVSFSLLHFMLIDLHHVEQEADSNLHECLCVCVCVTTANNEQIHWTTVQLVVLSQHVEVTALVLVPDLHLVVPTESNANLSLHLILSQHSRLGFALLQPPHIENTLFLRVMCFSLSGFCLAD